MAESTDLQVPRIQYIMSAVAPVEAFATSGPIWIATEPILGRSYNISLQDNLSEGVYLLYIQTEDCEEVYKIAVAR